VCVCVVRPIGRLSLQSGVVIRYKKTVRVCVCINANMDADTAHTHIQYFDRPRVSVLSCDDALQL